MNAKQSETSSPDADLEGKISLAIDRISNAATFLEANYEHAVIDAMLGAAGLGDIGEQFPDSDPAYEGIASSELLVKTREKIEKAGYEVSNIDVTVIAQEPKLSIYKGQMARRIAEVLGMEQEAVSVKAKTNEGVDAVGRGEAMACHAVVLLAG